MTSAMPTYLVSFGINHLSCFQDSEPVDILHPASSLPVKWLQHVEDMLTCMVVKMSETSFCMEGIS